MMRRPMALVLGLVLALSVTATAQQASSVVRVFQLRTLSISEATALVQPVLSPSGTLTVVPQDRTLTVQDRPDVVERVAAMLQSAEERPTSYHLVLRLLEASDGAVPPGERAVMVDERVQKMFRYGAYWEIGATEVRGEAGVGASARLGDRFSIRFNPKPALPAALGIWRGAPGDRRGKSAKPAVEAGDTSEGWTTGRPSEATVHSSQRMLLHDLCLIDGRSGGEPLLRTNVSIGPNQTVVLGATPSEGSGRALILIVEARSE